MNLTSILSVLDQVQELNGSYKALCPAHNDQVPSLSISSGNNQEVLLHCHAGCEYDEVKKAIVSLMKERLSQKYQYHDSEGNVIGEVVRFYDNGGNKKFFQRSKESGVWHSGSSAGLKSTPYNLPAVLKAIENGKRIFIVEGEKDVDRMGEEGHIATCNVGGVAMGWKDEHTEWLKGSRRVYVIADNDAPGHKHAWRTMESLGKTSVRCSVHYSPFGKDISEHFDLGHELRELEELGREEEPESSSYLIGEKFIFDTPAEVPALWGRNGKEILWAKGQGLTIVAPQGTGKTSLAALLVESLLGLSENVLGFPVQQTESLLYLAMDRPYQIASAMRRVFEPHGREGLQDKKFTVWIGPPEKDLGKNPEHLMEMCNEVGARTVFIDSLKDAALRLTDEASAQGWNLAVQYCLREGIQVCALHHPTKHTGRDADRLIDLSDVYGSGWVTAGMGSVLSMWGAVGSSFFELTQLKSPTMVLDPLVVRRNDRTGGMEVIGGSLDWAWFFTEPHSIADLCKHMFGAETSRGNQEKARRQVHDLLARGVIVKHAESGNGSGRPTTLYILRSPE